MTCEKCGHKEVFFQESSENYILKCPVCEKLPVLSKEESLWLIEKRYRDMDKLFIDYIENFDKRSLIVWLLGYREKLASKFITETPALKLNEFLSMNIIIKRAVEENNKSGLENANEGCIKEILSWYLEVIHNKELHFLVKEDFGYLIRRSDSYSERPNSNELFSNFEFAYDEDWMIIIDSFKQNLIMPGNSAEKYIEENKEEYEKNKIPSPESPESTPEETIHTLYPLLQSFKIGLTKNSLFAETFNFDYLENKKVLIEILLKLTEYFEFKHGMLLVVSVEEFKKFLRKKFVELDQDRLYTDLVFSYDNQAVFPFFIEVKDILPITTEKGTVEYENGVLVSKSVLKIIKIFYYPFYYEDLFNKETQCLSDQFEKIYVPKKFHENGFNVRVNIEKKSRREKELEIDTVAWNNNTLYVIETKIWDVTKLFEHRKSHNYRERDLKGIVDGYKYTKEIPKKIPSLIDKINYVKENLAEILSEYKETEMFPDYDTVDNNTNKKIVGVIVTKSYPPIKEYKGVKIIGFKEIELTRLN